jgi:hypothetical protein
VVHRGSQMMMCTEAALRYDQKSMKLHTRVSFVSPLSSNPLMQNSFCGTLFGNVLFMILHFLTQDLCLVFGGGETSFQKCNVSRNFTF